MHVVKKEDRWWTFSNSLSLPLIHGGYQGTIQSHKPVKVLHSRHRNIQRILFPRRGKRRNDHLPSYPSHNLVIKSETTSSYFETVKSSVPKLAVSSKLPTKARSSHPPYHVSNQTWKHTALSSSSYLTSHHAVFVYLQTRNILIFLNSSSSSIYLHNTYQSVSSHDLYDHRPHDISRNHTLLYPCRRYAWLLLPHSHRPIFSFSSLQTNSFPFTYTWWSHIRSQP